MQPIASGQQLLAVPLRLALKDYADDPEAAAHGLEDAPWAVRLAAKLLRELQPGPASQWAPYLQVSDSLAGWCKIPSRCLENAHGTAACFCPSVRC